MTRDEALQKIKKCLALAASPNEHEAAAALRQARKLMEQFSLTDADVSLADVAEQAQKAQNAPLVIWENCLAHMVADVFGCRLLTRVQPVLTRGLSIRKQRQFVFVGVGASAELAGYAFDVLSQQCAKDRRAYIGKQPKNCKTKTKVARGDRYAEGWIWAVQDKLEAFAGNKHYEELLTSYMQERYSQTQTVSAKDRAKGRNVTDGDFSHGHRAGLQANINHGLGASQAQARIGVTAS